MTCPLILLTLGLFTFVINAFLLMITASLGRMFGLGFRVEGFGAAFWGALVVSIVSVVLSLAFRDKESAA
jgi:putative membrane protein